MFYLIIADDRKYRIEKRRERSFAECSAVPTRKPSILYYNIYIYYEYIYKYIGIDGWSVCRKRGGFKPRHGLPLLLASRLH